MTPAEDRFEHLATRCGPRVLAYLVQRVLPREEAADVFQLVLTTTWRRILDVPDDDDHALAWMVAVARRELANHRRGAQRRGAATERLASELIASSAGQVQVDAAGEHVNEVLEGMDGGDRELLTLAYWEGLSSEQVGIVLGVTPATVRKRLQRARGRLRQALALGPEPAGAPARAR